MFFLTAKPVEKRAPASANFPSMSRQKWRLRVCTKRNLLIEWSWRPTLFPFKPQNPHSIPISAARCITIAYPVTELICSLMFPRTRPANQSVHANDVSPFPATHPSSFAKHPKIAPVTPLAATHPSHPLRKSFRCHTSKKRGGGVASNRHLPNSQPAWAGCCFGRPVP